MKGRASTFRPEGRGPFRVEHLAPGDPYELSDGHAIVREPAGKRHGRRNLVGGAVIESDPAVEVAAVDVGYALSDVTLRAPDVSVDVSAGGKEKESGFAVGAPALAVEYAERGRSKRDLERKIAELLAAGTKVVWVVRLGGERRVEVHHLGQAVTTQRSGDHLEAPGILRNPVPVDALYDREAAHEVTLRNLLERRGYASLDAVRATGALEHARSSLKRALELRGVAILPGDIAAIDSCGDLATLDAWLGRAVLATSRDEVFRS